MASKILTLPEYCDIFKFMLVEELVLSEPLDFHYGKCAVIGKLSQKNDKFYLQNIQLKSIAEEYQLQTGTVEILILPLRGERHNLVDGATAEVHGEPVFWRKNVEWSDSSKALPKTTRDLKSNLRRDFMNFIEPDSQLLKDVDEIPANCCSLNEDGINDKIKKLKIFWEPAIQMYTMRQINRAEEVIDMNLRKRLLLKFTDQVNNS